MSVKTQFGIVIPTKNMAAYLDTSIQSVIGQILNGEGGTPVAAAVEIIVVVDDLDPETMTVLERYEERLSWIEGDGRGQAAAVNKGLRLLNADVVKWLNADDALKPGTLDRVSSFFSSNESVDFVYGDIEFIDSKGKPIGLHREPPFSRFILLYGHNLFADPSCFWRSRVNHELGYISEGWRYSLDYEFWVRCVTRGVKFGQIREVLAQFRVTGENLSVKHIEKMRKEHFDILIQALPHLSYIPERLRLGFLSTALLAARFWKLIMATLTRGRVPVRIFKGAVHSATKGG